MTFGFAEVLGLIALVGIPIIIIIYLIKPRFQERKISSTYIWKLSLKYRKRKLPLQWLKSLLLIVQCILIAVLALLIAGPRLKNTSNAYQYEKIVILDASASMMTESNGKTRFERGKEELYEIIGDRGINVSAEDPITVILVSNTTERIVDKEANGQWARSVVEDAECTGVSATEKAYRDAIAEAKGIATRGGSDARIFLITDQQFEGTDENGMNGYIKVIDVSTKEWNFAIVDAFEGVETNEDSDDYGEKILIANYASYNASIRVIPCVDIEYRPTTSSEVYETKTVELDPVLVEAYDPARANDPDYRWETQAIFTHTKVKNAIKKRFTSYKSLKFYVKDESGRIIAAAPEKTAGGTLNNIADAFGDDNIFYAYGGENTKFKALVVDKDATRYDPEKDAMISDYTRSFTFLGTQAAGEQNYVIHFTSDVNEYPTEGYDLYVYDGVVPSELPVDGAVWLFDPDSKAYNDHGFTVGGEVNAKGGSWGGSAVDYDIAKINANARSNSILKAVNPNADKLMQKDGVEDGVFAYVKYKPLVNVENRYTTLITAEDGKTPLVISGTAKNGCKIVVFGFDLNDTDFPLVFQAFPQMFSNMLRYSTVHALENYMYDIGDRVTINTKPNTEVLTVTVGEGENRTEMNFYKSPELGGELNGYPIELVVERGGSYTVEEKVGDRVVRSTQFFVRCDPTESNFNSVGPRLVLENDVLEDMVDETVSEVINYADISMWFAIALIVLILLEWGLQYREQY